MWPYQLDGLCYFSYSAASLFLFSFWSLRAGGGQLSQGSLKLFVFDTRSFAGTVAFFRFLGGGVLVGDWLLGPSSYSSAIYKQFRTTIVWWLYTWEIPLGFDPNAAIERFTQRQVAGKTLLGTGCGASVPSACFWNISLFCLLRRPSNVLCAQKIGWGSGIDWVFPQIGDYGWER
jgi:hypothetical protein